MIVKVTKKHIRLGKRSCVSECPIALAMKDAGFERVGVSSDHAEYGDNFEKLVYLPGKVSEFIDAFDHQREVHPISFRVRKP